MGMTRRAVLAAGALASGLVPALSRAAAPGSDWPQRPLRFVVPYPPGGPTDILGRVVAQRLSVDLGQNVVVDNRGGASGVIGSGEVARGPADGNTFLVNASIHVIIPHLNPQMPFDTLADFLPVTNIAVVPLIVVVNRDLPVRSIPQLIAYLKARPGQCSFGSSGIAAAPHLAGELFKQLTGTEMVHVPYKGSGPALQDLMAGNIQVMFDSLPSSAGAVRDGRLRALAVTTGRRVPGFEELPTVAEAGVPGYEISTWYGVWAPAQTPPRIVTRLQSSIAKGLTEPDVKARLDALGAQPVGDTPEEFASFVRSEYERWGRLVKSARIEAQ